MRHTLIRAAICAGVGCGGAALAAPPTPVPVTPMASAPKVDGDLAEWGKDGWIKIAVAPAIATEDRPKYGLAPEDANATGKLTALLKAGVADGQIFIAVRWPDETEDADYKGWEWNGIKYAEGKKRDDMLAVRFHHDGDFDRSMLSGKTYSVDLWLWSAGRSNALGLAEDWTHRFSTQLIEDAAEYAVKGVGTVYIKKIRDEGEPLYRIVRPPRQKEAARVESFVLNKAPSGSVADVAAKGKWAAKFWSLEMARKLDTGNADDLAFKPGSKVLGQLAIWNRGSDENKSVSEPLLFDFSAIK